MEKSDSRVIQATRVTWIGLFTNIILTLLKLVAGILGRSGAMIADGIHSLSDFATDVVILMGFRIVNKPADKTHHYGHGKFETLIATFIGVILFLVGVKILWSGMSNVHRVFQGYTLIQPGWIALYAAIISVITKEWLYRYTVNIGNRINSQAIVANAWHHRSDVFSSVGTMLGIGGAIVLGEKWHILDPLAAAAVSFFIIKIGISISYGSINELLEASLSEEMEKKILQTIEVTTGVIDHHNMRTRRVGNSVAIDIHIKVEKSLNVVEAHDIATLVEQNLKNSLGKETFVSIHIEPSN